MHPWFYRTSEHKNLVPSTPDDHEQFIQVLAGVSLRAVVDSDTSKDPEDIHHLDSTDWPSVSTTPTSSHAGAVRSDFDRFADLQGIGKGVGKSERPHIPSPNPDLVIDLPHKPSFEPWINRISDVTTPPLPVPLDGKLRIDEAAHKADSPRSLPTLIRDLVVEQILPNLFPPPFGNASPNVTVCPGDKAASPAASSLQASTVRDGESCAPRRSKKQPHSRKRKRTNKIDDGGGGGDNNDEEDDGDQDKSGYDSSSGGESVREPRLACHFNKRDPSHYRNSLEQGHRYKGCTRGWRTTKALKEHTRRVHCRDYICVRCCTIFSQNEEYMGHALNPSGCLPQQNTLFHEENIAPGPRRDLVLQKKLTSRSETQHWYLMWSHLFPNLDPPDSPYKPSPLQRLWDRTVPDVISEAVQMGQSHVPQALMTPSQWRVFLEMVFLAMRDRMITHYERHGTTPGRSPMAPRDTGVTGSNLDPLLVTSSTMNIGEPPPPVLTDEELAAYLNAPIRDDEFTLDWDGTDHQYPEGELDAA